MLLAKRNEIAPPLDVMKIDALRKKHPQALATARQLTRFLCGLSSPALTQRKLNKDALFGGLAETPFHTIMKATVKLLK